MEILINHGADVKTEGGVYDSALQVAIAAECRTSHRPKELIAKFNLRHCVMEFIENPTVLEQVAYFNILCSFASLYKSAINLIMFLSFFSTHFVLSNATLR
jgi:hypothetical protein